MRVGRGEGPTGGTVGAGVGPPKQPGMTKEAIRVDHPAGDVDAMYKVVNQNVHWSTGSMARLE